MLAMFVQSNLMIKNKNLEISLFRKFLEVKRRKNFSNAYPEQFVNDFLKKPRKYVKEIFFA